MRIGHTRVRHTATCQSARSTTLRQPPVVRKGAAPHGEQALSHTVSRLCQHRGRGEPSPVKEVLLSHKGQSVHAP